MLVGRSVYSMLYRDKCVRSPLVLVPEPVCIMEMRSLQKNSRSRRIPCLLGAVIKRSRQCDVNVEMFTSVFILTAAHIQSGVNAIAARHEVNHEPLGS